MKSAYTTMLAQYPNQFVDDTIWHYRLVFKPFKQLHHYPFDLDQVYTGVYIEKYTKYNRCVHLAVGNEMLYNTFKEEL